MAFPGRWWHLLEDGRVQCDLCPRHCRLREGQQGLCASRSRQGDGIVSTVYGRTSGLAIDPVEKKPLYHFHPGSHALSFGTVGCNLTCRFCQNAHLSRAHPDALGSDLRLASAAPEAIAQTALAHQCASVAYTYNEPIVSAEYTMDAAEACRALGIQNIAVTAGYIDPAPRREFFARMDAANVDLKSFSEAFYQRQCGAHLRPVLETLIYIRHETSCWLELTTLVIPEHNDGDVELAALARWVRTELGPEVPLHLSAFHPAWRLRDAPPTPPGTLSRARRIALDQGLRYVYTGNIHDPEGSATRCPQCDRTLIEREGFAIQRCEITGDGRCPHCALSIAGCFDDPGRMRVE